MFFDHYLTRDLQGRLGLIKQGITTFIQSLKRLKHRKLPSPAVMNSPSGSRKFPNTTFVHIIRAITVNGERFGLNFCVFHGFQEHRESFPVNIYKLCIMVLLKYCKM